MAVNPKTVRFMGKGYRIIRKAGRVDRLPGGLVTGRVAIALWLAVAATIGSGGSAVQQRPRPELPTPAV